MGGRADDFVDGEERSRSWRGSRSKTCAAITDTALQTLSSTHVLRRPPRRPVHPRLPRAGDRRGVQGRRRAHADHRRRERGGVASADIFGRSHTERNAVEDPILSFPDPNHVGNAHLHINRHPEMR